MAPLTKSDFNSKSVIFVSLLPGDGGNGVETHVRHLRHMMQKRGVATTLITPYGGTFCLQRIANFVANRFVNMQPESTWLWLRRIYVHLLKKKLSSILKKASDPESLVLSAQDPLSAWVALQVRDVIAPQSKVLLTAHFNISEAEEFVDKGITKRGGALYQTIDRLEADVLCRVDHLIFVSEFLKRACEERIPRLKQSASQTIHNLIPEPQSRERGDVVADAIAIGSLEPRKNQQFLLRVFAECKRQGHSYSLTIVGSGEDQITLRNMAAELGISSQVNFLGQVRDAQSLIPSHRVLLHAAKMESFGIVLVEAMSYGVPVIANGVGGVRDVFSEGDGGLYWDVTDVAGASRKLIRFLEDASEVRSLSLHARANYEKKFNYRNLSEEWVSAIQG